MAGVDTVRSALRAASPAFALVGAVLLMALPLEIGAFGLSLPTPLVPMIVVFLYAVYDPDAVPTSMVFAVGILHDFLYGGAIGVWASIYVALQFLVVSQRDYFRGRVFHVIWLAFGIALLCLMPLLWLERSLVATRFLSVWPMFFQFGVTALAYPGIAWIFFFLRDRQLSEVVVR